MRRLRVLPLALAGFTFVSLAVVRLALDAHPGLNAEYFESLAPLAAPALTTVDSELSTRQIERRWPALSPAEFKVRWFGYLGIDAAATYTFSITADDGAVLSIDGAVVADTGSGRGTFTQVGRKALSAGLHAVAIDYRQSGGDYGFDWTWAREASPQEQVPSWRLASRRGAWPVQRAARLIDLSLLGLAAAFLTWAIVSLRTHIAGALRRHPVAALLVLFAALAVIQTWPLASDPGRLSRNDNADTVLNEWALAWVAHQAVTDPVHLFDANIFYPERYTLAYSESMIVQSAMAAPLLWSGASPVLAYNLVLMAGFALNGWAMAYVMRRWTGDSVAAIVAGILFAYNSNILTRLPHMQALHVEFLPLALLALDLVLRRRRPRHAVLLGTMCALQALTSVYLLVFTFSAMSSAMLARAGEWVAPRFIRVAALLLLSVAVAATIAGPFLLPYLWVHDALAFERSLQEGKEMAATLGSYLASPSRLHYGLWSYRWFASPSALFPGVTALALGGTAFLRGRALRDPRARMCLVMGMCGVLLSLGPKVPGYTLLFNYIPIFRVVRVTSSFGYLGLAGLAMVAGYGVVELRRLVAPRAWPFAAAAILTLVTVEPLAAPLELSPFAGVPRIYDVVRAERDAVVAELPFYTTAAGFAQARYMLNSTRHWRPMLNGYSGYRPPSYYENASALESFPSPDSIAWLQRRGVTHVFVQMGAYDAGMGERLAAVPALREIASDRGITLLRLVPGR
ncbi:MAG: PA14 domain-containing protein [Vicinamibacterales bacterium]